MAFRWTNPSVFDTAIRCDRILGMCSRSEMQNCSVFNRIPDVKSLLFALLCATLPLGVASAASPIKPFKAEYSTLRNGKPLGRTTIELRENTNGTWTLRSATTGTQGMASMLGLDVVEESIIRWRDDRPETITYDYRQEAALKQRKRHAEFDWQANEVHMIDGDSDARYALSPAAIDRNALTLALAADLAANRSSFEYKVVAKKELEDVRYAACGKANITVPAGNYETNCVERKREKRTSTSWFAGSLGWIPVQIEQIEKKGDTITLKLESISKP